MIFSSDKEFWVYSRITNDIWLNLLVKRTLEDSVVKKILLSLIMFGVMINGAVFASADEPLSFEEMYAKWGYTSINEALAQFENRFKKELTLPSKLPPIDFTHHFGKFDDLRDDINYSFSAEFVDNRHPENHYKINVRPVENRLKFNQTDIDDTFKLIDGSAALYSAHSQYHRLVFERDNWQYILSIDERVSDTVTPDILVSIANSF